MGVWSVSLEPVASTLTVRGAGPSVVLKDIRTTGGKSGGAGGGGTGVPLAVLGGVAVARAVALGKASSRLGLLGASAVNGNAVAGSEGAGAVVGAELALGPGVAVV